MQIARPLKSGVPLFLLGVLLVSFPIAAFQPSDAGLEGTWALVANNYKGRLEITRSGSGYTGRVSFSGSSWEPIDRISYNSRSGEVAFVRVIPNQVHRGTLSGNRMSGLFDNAYGWSATREGAAAPSPLTSGQVSTPPPTPTTSAAGLEGTWALVANNYTGRLEITRSGSGYTGRVSFSGGSWEPIDRISYNSRSGEVAFVRVIPNQVHRGTLSGNRMSGRFDNAYDWSATREGAAAPSSLTSGQVSTPPPTRGSPNPPPQRQSSIGLNGCWNRCAVHLYQEGETLYFSASWRNPPDAWQPGWVIQRGEGWVRGKDVFIRDVTWPSLFVGKPGPKSEYYMKLSDDGNVLTGYPVINGKRSSNVGWTRDK